MRVVSKEISRCSKLRTVDLSRTELAVLPSEISRLPNLTDLCLEGTTLDPALQAAADKGAAELVSRLAEEDVRADLRAKLYLCLSRDVYPEQADTSAGKRALESLVAAIVEEFAPPSTTATGRRAAPRKGIGASGTMTSLMMGSTAGSLSSTTGKSSTGSASAAAAAAAAGGGAGATGGVDFGPLRTVVRNAERLLHEDLFRASAPGARRAYEALSKDNARKQLAAQVELKVRALYFDRVEPEEARNIAAEATKSLRTLEDVTFLLRHAPSVFPEEHGDVESGAILARLTSLRRQLRAERAKALRTLSRALLDKYPDRTPQDADNAAKQLAKAGRLATKEVLALSSDIESLAPGDFRDIKPKRIVAGFRQIQAEKAAELGDGAAPGSAAATGAKVKAKGTRKGGLGASASMLGSAGAGATFAGR